MPYDMVIMETGEPFQANMSGMNMLREVMDGAGVNLYAAHPRSTTSEEEVPLWLCFTSMDGWVVRPEECREIARKLSEHTETAYSGGLLSPWDLEYIQKFSKYCEAAAGEGGFYVH